MDNLRCQNKFFLLDQNCEEMFFRFDLRGKVYKAIDGRIEKYDHNIYLDV